MYNPLTPFDEIHNIFLSNPFLLNFSKASSSIFTLTEKHQQKAEFCSLSPGKFPNTNQELECPSRTFTRYKISLKEIQFPTTQMSAVCLKNEFPYNSVTRTPSPSISSRIPETRKSSVNLGIIHHSMELTCFLTTILESVPATQVLF